MKTEQQEQPGCGAAAAGPAAAGPQSAATQPRLADASSGAPAAMAGSRLPAAEDPMRGQADADIFDALFSKWGRDDAAEEANCLLAQANLDSAFEDLLWDDGPAAAAAAAAVAAASIGWQRTCTPPSLLSVPQSGAPQALAKPPGPAGQLTPLQQQQQQEQQQREQEEQQKVPLLTPPLPWSEQQQPLQQQSQQWQCQQQQGQQQQEQLPAAPLPPPPPLPLPQQQHQHQQEQQPGELLDAAACAANSMPPPAPVPAAASAARHGAASSGQGAAFGGAGRMLPQLSAQSMLHLQQQMLAELHAPPGQPGGGLSACQLSAQQLMQQGGSVAAAGPAVSAAAAVASSAWLPGGPGAGFGMPAPAPCPQAPNAGPPFGMWPPPLLQPPLQPPLLRPAGLPIGLPFPGAGPGPGPGFGPFGSSWPPPGFPPAAAAAAGLFGPAAAYAAMAMASAVTAQAQAAALPVQPAVSGQLFWQVMQATQQQQQQQQQQPQQFGHTASKEGAECMAQETAMASGSQGAAAVAAAAAAAAAAASTVTAANSTDAQAATDPDTGGNPATQHLPLSALIGAAACMPPPAPLGVSASCGVSAAMGPPGASLPLPPPPLLPPELLSALGLGGGAGHPPPPPLVPGLGSWPMHLAGLLRPMPVQTTSLLQLSLMMQAAVQASSLHGGTDTQQAGVLVSALQGLACHMRMFMPWTNTPLWPPPVMQQAGQQQEPPNGSCLASGGAPARQLSGSFGGCGQAKAAMHFGSQLHTSTTDLSGQGLPGGQQHSHSTAVAAATAAAAIAGALPGPISAAGTGAGAPDVTMAAVPLLDPAVACEPTAALAAGPAPPPQQQQPAGKAAGGRQKRKGRHSEATRGRGHEGGGGSRKVRANNRMRVKGRFVKMGPTGPILPGAGAAPMEHSEHEGSDQDMSDQDTHGQPSGGGSGGAGAKRSRRTSSHGRGEPLLPPAGDAPAPAAALLPRPARLEDSSVFSAPAGAGDAMWPAGAGGGLGPPGWHELPLHGGSRLPCCTGAAGQGGGACCRCNPAAGDLPCMGMVGACSSGSLGQVVPHRDNAHCECSADRALGHGGDGPCCCDEQRSALLCQVGAQACHSEGCAATSISGLGLAAGDSCGGVVGGATNRRARPNRLHGCAPTHSACSAELCGAAEPFSCGGGAGGGDGCFRELDEALPAAPGSTDAAAGSRHDLQWHRSLGAAPDAPDLTPCSRDRLAARPSYEQGAAEAPQQLAALGGGATAAASAGAGAGCSGVSAVAAAVAAAAAAASSAQYVGAHLHGSVTQCLAPGQHFLPGTVVRQQASPQPQVQVMRPPSGLWQPPGGLQAWGAAPHRPAGLVPPLGLGVPLPVNLLAASYAAAGETGEAALSPGIAGGLLPAMVPGGVHARLAGLDIASTLTAAAAAVALPSPGAPPAPAPTPTPAAVAAQQQDDGMPGVGGALPCLPSWPLPLIASPSHTHLAAAAAAAAAAGLPLVTTPRPSACPGGSLSPHQVLANPLVALPGAWPPLAAAAAVGKWPPGRPPRRRRGKAAAGSEQTDSCLN